MSDRARDLRLLACRHWPHGERFFERARPDLEKPQGVGFRALYASVPRRLAALAKESVAAPAELGDLTRPHWDLTDYVRAALVATAFERLTEVEQPAFLLTLFEAGEIGEQVSVLRTLSLLAEPARFL